MHFTVYMCIQNVQFTVYIWFAKDSTENYLKQSEQNTGSVMSAA